MPVLEILSKKEPSSEVQEEANLSKMSNEDLDKLMEGKGLVDPVEDTQEEESSDPKKDEGKEKETKEEETQEESTESCEEEGGEAESETEEEGTSEEVRVHFMDFGEDAVELQVIYYIEDSSRILDIRHAVNNKIKASFEESGISLAFKTLTVKQS